MSEQVEQKKDYLRVDNDVPGQRYFCVSFVEPTDDVFIEKEHFLFCKFMDLIQEKKESFLELYQDKNTEKIDMNVLKKDYQDWRTTKYNEWSKEFDENNNNRNSMRGFKVRGSYNTLEEAKERAEELRTEDPNFHVFVGSVGFWIPFNPVNFDNIESVYQEEMLNEIVKENLQQKKKINKAFEERKLGMVEKAKKQVALEKQLKENKESTEKLVNDVMENQQDNTLTNKENQNTQESEII